MPGSKPAKTGHSLHSSKIFVLFCVLFVLCPVYWVCFCVNVYCTTATGWLPNCSKMYHIMSYHITSYQNTNYVCIHVFQLLVSIFIIDLALLCNRVISPCDEPVACAYTHQLPIQFDAKVTWHALSVFRTSSTKLPLYLPGYFWTPKK